MAMFAKFGLELNAKSEIIEKLDVLRKDENKKDLAEGIARQIMDNALLTAGLLDSSIDTVDRINKLLSVIIEPESKYTSTESDKQAEVAREANREAAEAAEKMRLEQEEAMKAETEKITKEALKAETEKFADKLAEEKVNDTVIEDNETTEKPAEEEK